MKTYDSDSEYNSNINSCNGIQEVTNLLTSKRGQTLIKCNPDLAQSFDVIKSIPMSQNGHFFKQVLLKSTVTQDSRSHSLPNSLNEKNKLDIINSMDCDIHTKLLSENENTTIIQDFWFNTWPERYEKPKQNDVHAASSEATNTTITSLPNTCTLDKTNKSNNKKITLNEALQNISLAYSPITKQLHLIQREVIEQKEDINHQSEELKKSDHFAEDCCNVKKSKHRRTEASSFSSTVSSLSDISASGSLLGADDKSSTSSDDKNDEKKRRGSFFNRNMFSWKLFNKSKQELVAHNSPQHQHVIASSSALIENSRPSTLPAKATAEDQRHKEEYKAILAAAKKKEAQNNVAKQKQQKMQLQVEEQQAYATKYFQQTVLPNWDSTRCAKKTINLWWHGLPSSVRGKIWRLAIGNELNLTQQLYEICLSRAQNRLNSPAPSHSENEIDQESSMDVIQLDIARTFPTLCIFQEGGPYSDVLHSLLAAYVCYRPDVGYVQGMSYIAAVLILNMEQLDAFICFANLLNKPLHIAAFTLNQLQMQAYYQAFNEVFNHNLPKLYLHFCKSGLTPDLYLLDWIYTVYAKAMPLDVACRVWDVFLRDGDEFIFRAALGILHLHQDMLLTMDFLHGAQFLTRLPDDLSSDHLFKSIQTVSTSVGKQTFQQIVERYHVSTHNS